MAALDTKKHIAVGNLTKKGKMSTIRQSKTHCLNKRKRPLHSEVTGKNPVQMTSSANCIVLLMDYVRHGKIQGQ